MARRSSPPVRKQRADAGHDRAALRKACEERELSLLHGADPLIHYVWNARDVCKLQGVGSIEMWRVTTIANMPATCLFCVKMAKP